MTDNIENEIRRQLLANIRPAQIFSSLSYKLHDESCSDQDKRSLLLFAYNSGLIRPIADNLAIMVRQKKYFPPDLLIEILALNIKLQQQELVGHLLKAVNELNLADEVIFSYRWDRLTDEIKSLRKHYLQKKSELLKKQRHILMEKLTFYRSEHLFEEEKKTLGILAKIWPQDPEIAILGEEFKERWARFVIGQRQSEMARSYQLKVEITDPREKKFLDFLGQELLQLAQMHPHYAYDFAILLSNMGEPINALRILINSPERLDSDWLRSELLLQSQLNIECLEYLLTLENRYAENPETAFAVTYMRAQALWQLGQHHAAIELLQTLLQVRPNYRSASSLLTEWTEMSK